MRYRLRKAFVAASVASAVATGHADPLTAALDWVDHMHTVVQEQQSEPEPQVEARAPSPSRSSERGLIPPLILIRTYESHGDYSAYNPTGCEGYGCGGAFQLHARYASEWARRAGYPGMPANARLWPPSIQDAVATDLYYSTNPDGYHWCHWVDYC